MTDETAEKPDDLAPIPTAAPPAPAELTEGNRVVPQMSAQRWFTNVTVAAASAYTTPTGDHSASDRKRASLVRSASSIRWRSVTSRVLRTTPATCGSSSRFVMTVS